MNASRGFRGVFRREVLILCFVIFLADCIWSLLSPTFSVFAKSLGASLSLVGILSGLAGLTQFVSSVPLGLQSDRLGRKVLIVAGFVVYAASMLVFALSREPGMLVPGRVLFGLATVMTFTIGAAYLGDVIEPAERGAAFGLYSTSMGLGATVGPLIGAAIEPTFGIAGSYAGGAVIALAGGAAAAWGLVDTRKLRPAGVPQHRGPALGTMLRPLRDPNLLAASLATLTANTSFIGLIANFFPLHAASLGAPQAAINSMFSGRSFASTLTRLPAGILSSRFSRWAFILTALGAMGLAVFGMTAAQDVAALALLLVAEGVAFGTFLTVGQSFVAEHSAPETRGAAIGVYSMAGSMGSTFSPFVLGFVADAFGIVTAFRLTAVAVAAGLVVISVLYARGRRRPVV